MSAFITKQVTFSIDNSSRCKCQDCRHQGVRYVSNLSNLCEILHPSRSSGSMVYDSEHQSRTSVQEKKLRKICSTCISRNQRDILRISWNVVCKLVVIKFVQSVTSTLCTVSREFKLGIVYQFLTKSTANNSQGARAASESFVTTSCSCAEE